MYYKKYMPGLDIIRAAALLSVLLFHLFPRAFPGGFLGVETFFVLTGFLLTINDGPERIFTAGNSAACIRPCFSSSF